MSGKDLRQFALAVFFLFAAIGPLNLLMDGDVIPGSWYRLLVLTILSGGLAASIILFMGRIFLLLASVLLYVTAIMAIGLTDPEFLKPDVPAMTLTADQPMRFSEDQITDMREKRVAFGMTAIFCIAIGYALFVRSLSRENKRRAEIESEVRLAQTIHESLLPKQALTTSWCDIAGQCIPAAQIGGDFFDIIPLSEKKLFVVIADASGHGAGAGIVAAMTKSGILQELQHTSDPAEMVNNVNTMLHAATEKNMFITCAVALFDRTTETASIVTAGHPPVFRVSAVHGSVEEFRSPNMALGIRPRMDVQAISVRFSPSDRFLFVTDGVFEAARRTGEQFGAERVKHHFRHSTGASSSADTGSLIAAVQTFAGDGEVNDDITAVTVRIL